MKEKEIDWEMVERLAIKAYEATPLVIDFEDFMEGFKQGYEVAWTEMK